MASRKKPEPSPKRLYSSYVRRCKARNTFWGLTPEEFHSITQQACIYCGKAPNQKNRNYIYNGIDRKNNKRGYTPENSAPCCGTCNAVKSDRFSYEQMKKIGRILSIIHTAEKKRARK